MRPARYTYEYVLRLLTAGGVKPDEAHRIAREFPLTELWKVVA